MGRAVAAFTALVGAIVVLTLLANGRVSLGVSGGLPFLNVKFQGKAYGV